MGVFLRARAYRVAHSALQSVLQGRQRSRSEEETQTHKLPPNQRRRKHFLVGLIVFAVLIKLILIPFGIKQQSNSIKQSRYKPREMAIRRKYAGRNDKATQQKMNNEIMEMYQKDGASPMGGCLPMLLQMAIILLLYQVIIHPLLYVVGVSQESVTAMTEYFKASVESGGLGISLARYQEITIMKEALARGQEAFAAD
jgi:YidC/Oxa1 family membrane protein insertase